VEPSDLIQRIPSAVGSGEDAQSLASGGVHKKNGSEPSDLEQDTRQPSDRTGAARGLPSGLQPSAYRESRGQEIETLQVSKHREDLDRPLVETRGGDRGIGSRDIGIPVDRRSGKSIENPDII
jgi:hypothetical protein